MKMTKEMIKTIKEAEAKVRGTSDFNKYQGESYICKKNAKKWYFTGWTSWYESGKIKNVRGKLYVYYSDSFLNANCRISLPDSVCELLGL